jgi:hypothetical protein
MTSENDRFACVPSAIRGPLPGMRREIFRLTDCLRARVHEKSINERSPAACRVRDLESPMERTRFPVHSRMCILNISSLSNELKPIYHFPMSFDPALTPTYHVSFPGRRSTLLKHSSWTRWIGVGRYWIFFGFTLHDTALDSVLYIHRGH